MGRWLRLYLRIPAVQLHFSIHNFENAKILMLSCGNDTFGIQHREASLDCVCGDYVANEDLIR